MIAGLTAAETAFAQQVANRSGPQWPRSAGAGDQPGGGRRQQAGRQGSPRRQPPDAGASALTIRRRRCRRRAHSRDLPPSGPWPRQRHSRGSSICRTARVDVVYHISRRRQDRRQGDQLRRQQPGLVEPPARRHDDDREQSPELPEEHGRLRSRPDLGRSGADPPLLPQERLRGFPHRLERRAVRSCQEGYVVTIAVDEGQQYRVGSVNVESRIPDVDGETLRARHRDSAGSVYNADAVEKSLQDITTDVVRNGLRLRAGPPDAAPATRPPRRSISATWSRTARASTSSASTSAATPAPATT